MWLGYYKYNRVITTYLSNTENLKHSEHQILVQTWSCRQPSFTAGGWGWGGDGMWHVYIGDRDFLSKLNIPSLHVIRSSNHAPWYWPNWIETLHPHKNLYMNIHRFFIPTWQELELSNMSSKSQVDKQLVVNPYNKILFSDSRKWGIKSWKHLEES